MMFAKKIEQILQERQSKASHLRERIGELERQASELQRQNRRPRSVLTNIDNLRKIGGEQLRIASNNERLLRTYEGLHAPDGYNILRRLAASGDPLCRQVQAYISAPGSDDADLNDRFIWSIINRSMTRETYMETLQGKRPFAHINTYNRDYIGGRDEGDPIYLPKKFQLTLDQNKG